MDFVEGFVGVYNPDALYTDVEQFCKRKHYFGASLAEELACAGLNVGAQVALADLAEFDRAKCIFVTDLDAYTSEQKEMLAKSKLPILAIGENTELPIKNRINYSGKYLNIALYNAECAPDFSELASLERAVRKAPSMHGEIWTEPLSHRRVAPQFFVKLAELLNESFALDRAPCDVKLASYRCEGQKYVILSNDRHTYYLPTIKTASDIKSATAIMKDLGYKVKCENNTFTVRIPPRCAEIVKIEE